MQILCKGIKTEEGPAVVKKCASLEEQFALRNSSNPISELNLRVENVMRMHQQS